jgi:hypothetical protein
MKRSDFLNRFFVLIGISSPSILIYSCSLEEDDTNEDVKVLSEEEILYQELKDKTAETGSFLDGKLLHVDITNDNYSPLTDKQILIINKSVQDSRIKIYSLNENYDLKEV